MNKIYFNNLDKLRFFSFFSVFAWHCFGYFKTGFFSGADRKIAEFIAGVGFLGVNFFFVLSGFLITWLLISEKEKTGKINIGAFYLRRVLRIWPLYFLIILIGFFLVPYLTVPGYNFREVKNHFFNYIFFFANFDRMNSGFTGAGNDNLGVMWSVAIEEQFYLFWPLLLFLFKKNGQVLVIITFIFASIIFRALNIDKPAVIYLHTFSVMGDLAMGGLLAWIFCHYPGLFAKANRLKKTTVVKNSVCFFLVLIVLLYKNLFTTPAFVIIERFVFSCIFCFIILLNISANMKIEGYIGNKLIGMGKITYGFYCFNLLIIGVTQKMFLLAENKFEMFKEFPGKFYLESLVAFVLCLIVCQLSFRFYEDPFLRLKKKFGG